MSGPAFPLPPLLLPLLLLLFPPPGDARRVDGTADGKQRRVFYARRQYSILGQGRFENANRRETNDQATPALKSDQISAFYNINVAKMPGREKRNRLISCFFILSFFFPVCRLNVDDCLWKPNPFGTTDCIRWGESMRTSGGWPRLSCGSGPNQTGG